MAAEAKRRCGHRKVGGKYLVSGNLGMPCCKMPIILTTCPCCGEGIKQARGWTWIDPKPFVQGECTADSQGQRIMCPLNFGVENIGSKVGLLWVGERFYPTPQDFVDECNEMGLSKRIARIPHGFKVGETWVFLAHPKVKRILDVEASEKAGTEVYKWLPGIFRIFKPTAIEQLVTESQAKDPDFMKGLERQNITPVIVPDDDPDHHGTVYDKPDQEELELNS